MTNTTMKPWWSAEDHRAASSATLAIALEGIAIAVIVGIGVVWVVGGFQPMATLPDWIGLSTAIAGAVAAVIALIGWTVVGVRVLWPRMAPTGQGFATRGDVARELSDQAARKKAAVTRPGLSRGDRRKVPAEQIAVPFHETSWGHRCWLPLENPTGLLAPTQSGKSLTDLLHKVLAAPGALLTTSTKLDLFRLTAMHRERLHGKGTVAVLDLTGTTGWPFQIRWNPLTGCGDWRTAKRRAQAFVAGVDPTEKTAGNHRFFQRRGAEILACYMQAACVSGAPLDVFISWCMDDTDPTAAEILMNTPDCQDHGLSLRKSQNVVAETRDGFWETVRDAISCLTDPLTRATCVDDTHGDAFNTARFLDTRGTVYVLGSEESASDLAPLVTAFVENLLFEARELALAQSATSDGRERLDPPLTAVLDELPSICPLPTLPRTISDSAGRGVLVHWAAQARAQLVTAFGKEGAETLMDNTTALSVLGGLKSQETLEWLSVLCGRRIEERRSRKRSPLELNLDRQISQEKTDLLTPAQIRELPAGRALVILRAMKPLIAVTRKGWELPEWERLQADRATVIARGQEDVVDDVDTTLRLIEGDAA